MESMHYEVNAEGLKQIAELLRFNHKRGEALATNEILLQGLAASIEYHYKEFEEAYFIIDAADDLSNTKSEYYITEDGLESKYIH